MKNGNKAINRHWERTEAKHWTTQVCPICMYLLCILLLRKAADHLFVWPSHPNTSCHTAVLLVWLFSLKRIIASLLFRRGATFAPTWSKIIEIIQIKYTLCNLRPQYNSPAADSSQGDKWRGDDCENRVGLMRSREQKLSCVETCHHPFKNSNNHPWWHLQPAASSGTGGEWCHIWLHNRTIWSVFHASPWHGGALALRWREINDDKCAPGNNERY